MSETNVRPQFPKGSIERLEGVHNSVISNWIKNMGKTIKDKLYNIADSIDNKDFKKENIKVLEADKNKKGNKCKLACNL